MSCDFVYLTCFGFFCVNLSILSFLVKPQSKLKHNIFFNLPRISRRFLKPTLVTAACKICYWNKHSTKFYFSKLCWHFFRPKAQLSFNPRSKYEDNWPVCILEVSQQHKKGLSLFCTCSKQKKKDVQDCTFCTFSCFTKTFVAHFLSLSHLCISDTSRILVSHIYYKIFSRGNKWLLNSGSFEAKKLFQVTELASVNVR